MSTMDPVHPLLGAESNSAHYEYDGLELMQRTLAGVEDADNLTNNGPGNGSSGHILGSDGSDDQMLVHVSTPLLLLTMSPLLVMVWISFQMHLSLERPIIIGTIRAFVQLSILGLILEPIFIRGESCSPLVLGYITLMVMLAAYEGMNRSKYRFPGMYLAVLMSLAINVGWTSCFAFGVILRPKPIWNPQYVIPIIGMLLGNSVNGVSLSLNAMLTSMVEQRREIELYLSFGATPREAAARLLREAVRVSSVPQLNSMAVIGLISIPGMMTGQILGGSPVREAAHYQMLICYLIAMCSFGTIITEVHSALQTGFDDAFRLRTDFFVPKAKQNQSGMKCCEWRAFLRFCCCCFNCCCGWFQHPADEIGLNGDSSEATKLISNSPKNTMEITKVRQSAKKEESFRLEVSNLTHSFVADGSDEEEQKQELSNGYSGVTKNGVHRILFENLSLELRAGEITLISGSSGVGKTTLLRLIAGLEPFAHNHMGYIQLQVPPSAQTSFQDGPKMYTPLHDRTLWRRQVRYVTQYKVDMPGTPKTCIERITGLHVEKHHDISPEMSIHTTTMMEEVRELIVSWGMTASNLESEWTTLSGGEAQRVIVAIALASRPRVLLLDEATGALDMATKLRVEKSIGTYCETSGMSVLWITHDAEQMKRLAASSKQNN